jgi:hypothetical protein
MLRDFLETLDRLFGAYKEAKEINRKSCIISKRAEAAEEMQNIQIQIEVLQQDMLYHVGDNKLAEELVNHLFAQYEKDFARK